MSLRSLLIIGLVALCGCAGTKPLPISSIPANCWTGKELLIWDGKTGFALDPQKSTWRRISNANRNTKYPRMHWLGDGKALAVYWQGEKTEKRWQSVNSAKLCIDHYFPATDTWQRIATIPREGFTFDAKDFLQTAGIALLGDSQVVFVDSNASFTSLEGARLFADGTVRMISRNGAPISLSGTVHASGQQVLFVGHHIAEPKCSGLWQATSDQWQEVNDVFIYDYGHCTVGDRLYFFGGATGKNFVTLMDAFRYYSFGQKRFKYISAANAPTPRRGMAMRWTGKRILVFGGTAEVADSQRDTIRPREQASATGAEFDPQTEKWKPIPSLKKPLIDLLRVQAWTGKELLIWGTSERNQNLLVGYAYNPETRSWRTLASLHDYLLTEH
jgi:hypothetical protein